MACVHIFEMTSPEIDKRNQKNEKMGLNKAQISIVLGAMFTECQAVRQDFESGCAKF